MRSRWQVCWILVVVPDVLEEKEDEWEGLRQRLHCYWCCRRQSWGRAVHCFPFTLVRKMWLASSSHCFRPIDSAEILIILVWWSLVGLIHDVVWAEKWVPLDALSKWTSLINVDIANKCWHGIKFLHKNYSKYWDFLSMLTSLINVDISKKNYHFER